MGFSWWGVRVRVVEMVEKLPFVGEIRVFDFVGEDDESVKPLSRPKLLLPLFFNILGLNYYYYLIFFL